MNVIEWIRYGAAAVLMLSGLVLMLSGLFGVFRFRFAVNRMHCAGMIDTLGLLLLFAGLALISDGWNEVLKLLVILVLFWTGSPLCSHLLARMALATDTAAPLHVKEQGASLEDIKAEEMRE